MARRGVRLAVHEGKARLKVTSIELQLPPGTAGTKAPRLSPHATKADQPRYEQLELIPV